MAKLVNRVEIDRHEIPSLTLHQAGGKGLHRSSLASRRASLKAAIGFYIQLGQSRNKGHQILGHDALRGYRKAAIELANSGGCKVFATLPSGEARNWSVIITPLIGSGWVGGEPANDI